MKNKLSIIILLIFLINACSAPYFVPKPQYVDVNPYGAFITLKLGDGTTTKGELLAVDSTQIIILEFNDRFDSSELDTVRVIPYLLYKNYKVEYAFINYGWTIPLYTAVTITHGWFLIFTAPINWLVTIPLTADAASAYTYDKKDLPFDYLKIFARFPQGIPEGISYKSIKPPKRIDFEN
jgi:hypothetical protein